MGTSYLTSNKGVKPGWLKAHKVWYISCSLSDEPLRSKPDSLQRQLVKHFVPNAH